MKKIKLLVPCLLAIGSITAQTTSDDGKVNVIKCSYFGISRPLSELFEVNPAEEDVPAYQQKESKDREHRVAQTFIHSASEGPEYQESMEARQTTMGTRQAMAPLTNWGGQTGGGAPPDPSGEAGLAHFVQAVNATPFKVYNKTNGAAVGTVKNIGSLWSPAVSNDGDPIVMYDKFADRWFLSQFGLNNNEMYIAISTSGDPSGSYYTYTFNSPDFPDYLKFSIWWDGYYMTANYSDKVFCFERDEMLNGNPNARAFSKSFSGPSGTGFFVPLPGSADGPLPASGTPCPIFYYTDNAWGGSNTDAIKILKMTTTWGATPSATISLDATVPLLAFDASYNSNWDDIPQPGTTDKLDGIGGVLTYRAPWRKWTGYNSVVLNFGVKLSSTQRSIRWVELRQDQTSGVWSKYQEGTYAPDATSRWVGSIAMDDNGNIALCYAASNSTDVYPSLCYTGRLANDPLGTMTFTETVAKAGTGSQTGFNRFGDYSHTSLDPDGLTFWHTGEYMGGSGTSGTSRTRIYSFRLDNTPMGIDSKENAPTFIYYQAENVLNIKASKLPSDEELTVDLFDITGKEISKKKITPTSNSFETAISVQGLAPGSYLVRVGKTNFQKVIKVIIK